MKALSALLLLAVALPAFAETAYVTERLPVVLRAGFADGSPVVKVIEGGATLEVLERIDRFAQVRDAQGTEGWIEARFLVNNPPARAQLDRTQAELTKARADLAGAQQRIAQLEAKVAQESARGVELAQSAQQAKAAASLAEQQAAQAVTQAAEVPAPADDGDFSWGWLVLAFAMLWIGFGAGVVWLRERHRKRLGGMYLRI
jgi:SH3 domain protein